MGNLSFQAKFGTVEITTVATASIDVPAASGAAALTAGPAASAEDPAWGCAGL